MDDSHFQPHATVRLATGGPKMTVVGPAAVKGRLWCELEVGGYRCGGAFDRRKLIVVDSGAERSPTIKQNSDVNVLDGAIWAAW